MKLKKRSQLEESFIPEKSKRVIEWGEKIDNFMTGNGEDPGPHPDPNHLYNIDKEAFKK